MRAVLQRVADAAVTVDGESIGAIGSGLLVLLGVAAGDTADDAAYIARKTAEVRIFAGEDGRFDRSLLDTGGAALVVSQFTLFGDTRHGRRPGFTAAAPPEQAEPMVDETVGLLRGRGIPVQTGRFGAHMTVALVNDGPVTLIIDSRDR